MFEVKTCPDCKKLYLRFSGRVCPQCHSIRQRQLNNAIGLVKARPGLPIKEVSRLCDIAEQILQDFAEEGTFRRLNLSVQYPCRLCATTINNGTICSSCHEELSRHIIDLRSKMVDERPGLRPVQVSGHYDETFSPQAGIDPAKRSEALKSISTRREKNRRSQRHAGIIR